VKYIFIIFFSFYSLFFNNGLKAAEKINIKFEEMEIPLTIEQLSKLEKYKEDSTELIDWLKKNGFIRVFELSKFLEFPVFKEEGLNREILRSWIGRKILTELSKSITVPNDNNGTEIYNTIENLLDQLIKFKENEGNLSSFEIATNLVRTSPYKSLAAHVIGYTQSLTESEYKLLSEKGYKLNDLIGRTGIE